VLRTLTSTQTLVRGAVTRIRAQAARDDGQSTAEYALVLLGAAGVAAVLIAWVTGSGRITDLLDGVLDQVMARVS